MRDDTIELPPLGMLPLDVASERFDRPERDELCGDIKGKEGLDGELDSREELVGASRTSSQSSSLIVGGLRAFVGGFRRYLRTRLVRSTADGPCRFETAGE